MDYLERVLTQVEFLDARADAAQQRAASWTVNPAQGTYSLPPEPERVASRAESVAWQQAGDIVRKTEALLTDERYALPGDPRDHEFRLDRFTLDQDVEPEVAAAMNAVRSDESDAWDRRSDRALLLLTVTGASLVLLGSAAAMAGSARAFLAAPAILLAAISTVSGLALIRQDTTQTNPEAVRLTVEAGVLRRTAQLYHRRNELGVRKKLLEEAVEKVDRAIALDAGYHLAHDVLADLLFDQGSFQLPGEQSSITDPKALPRIIDARREAAELDGGNFEYLLALGFEEFLAGRYAASEAATRRALRIREGSSVALGNLGVVLAAQGKESEAFTAYDRMAKAIEPNHLSTTYAGARTDIEILARDVPEAAPLARRLSEHLVRRQLEARLKGSELAPSPDITGLSVELGVSDGILTSTVKGDRKGLPLAHVWFYRPDTSSPWGEKPTYSWFPNGPANLGTKVTINRGLCLAAGHYRVDLYAAGRWAGTSEFELAAAPLGALIPYEDRWLSFRTCRPAGWTVTKHDSRTNTVFTSPDRSMSIGLGTVDVGGYAATGLTTDQRSTVVRAMAADLVRQVCDEGAVTTQAATMPGLNLSGWSATATIRGGAVCTVVAALKYTDRQKVTARYRTEDPLHFMMVAARDGSKVPAIMTTVQRSTVWQPRDF